MTVDEWLNRYRGKMADDGIRLGQRFVNMCGINFWHCRNDLFYEDNEGLAEVRIREWCDMTQYTHSLPLHRGSM